MHIDIAVKCSRRKKERREIRKTDSAGNNRKAMRWRDEDKINDSESKLTMKRPSDGNESVDKMQRRQTAPAKDWAAGPAERKRRDQHRTNVPMVDVELSRYSRR